MKYAAPWATRSCASRDPLSWDARLMPTMLSVRIASSIVAAVRVVELSTQIFDVRLAVLVVENIMRVTTLTGRGLHAGRPMKETKDGR
jgi:hypothetical protein